MDNFEEAEKTLKAARESIAPENPILVSCSKLLDTQRADRRGNPSVTPFEMVDIDAITKRCIIGEGTFPRIERTNLDASTSLVIDEFRYLIARTYSPLRIFDGEQIVRVETKLHEAWLDKSGRLADWLAFPMILYVKTQKETICRPTVNLPHFVTEADIPKAIACIDEIVPAVNRKNVVAVRFFGNEGFLWMLQRFGECLQLQGILYGTEIHRLEQIPTTDGNVLVADY